jgi:hypothetical protein
LWRLGARWTSATNGRGTHEMSRGDRPIAAMDRADRLMLGAVAGDHDPNVDAVPLLRCGGPEDGGAGGRVKRPSEASRVISRAYLAFSSNPHIGIYGPRVQWEQDRRGTHPGSGDRSQTPWSSPASGRGTSGRPSRSHRPRPAGPSHRTRRAGAAGSPGLRFDFLPSPVRHVPTPGFFTTCKPASFHPIQPPTSVLAFFHPA